MPTPLGSQPAAHLIRELSSDDGAARAAASAELFRRGAAIVPDLQRAGAKPIVGLGPSRLDAVYTLISNTATPPHRSDSIGLILAPGVTRTEIEAMGRRRGFMVPADTAIHSDTRPTCYVQLQPGQTPPGATTSILAHEPRVVSATFDMVDE
jgi:hypothetical protein